jgi:hypothetical protein
VEGVGGLRWEGKSDRGGQKMTRLGSEGNYGKVRGGADETTGGAWSWRLTLGSLVSTRKQAAEQLESRDTGWEKGSN